MKKFLLLALLTVLTVPAFAQTAAAYSCQEDCIPWDEAEEDTPEDQICCVPRDEATDETDEEDICPAEPTGMVPMNPNVMRNAFLQKYVNRLEELGGTYVEGMNRFEVMRAIFEIEKGL